MYYCVILKCIVARHDFVQMMLGRCDRVTVQKSKYNLFPETAVYSLSFCPNLSFSRNIYIYYIPTLQY